METAHYYLLVDFGKTLSHFFLIEIQSQESKLFGPVEIPSLFFTESTQSNLIFIKAIRELELLSQRKILSNGIVVISADCSKTTGVQQAFFISNEDYRDKIDLFKAVGTLRTDDVQKAAYQHFNQLHNSCSLIDAGSGALRFYSPGLGNKQTVSTPFGTGNSALYLLREEYSPEDILRWLPFEMEIINLENYIANKSLFSQTIPYTERDIAIEGAMMREMLRIGKPEGFLGETNEGENKTLILTGGSFSKSPSLGRTGLILLDGLEPEGICEFLIDKKQFFNCFGGLLTSQISVVQQIDSQNYFVHFLTAISISGKISENEPLGSVFINSGFEEVQEIRLKGGEIFYIPGNGQTIECDFRLNQKLSIKGIKEADSKVESTKIKITTGSQGFVIDARGRPLIQPRPSMEGRKLLKKWNDALNITTFIEDSHADNSSF